MTDETADPAYELAATTHLPAPVRKSDGGPMARFLGPFFQRISVEPEAADRLRRAYAEGIVIHVLRSRRIIDPLFILHLLGKLGLPRPAWMHEHFASEGAPDVPGLVEAIRRSEPALLFLRRPKTLGETQTGYAEGHVEALLHVQKELGRPILLLPVSLHFARGASGLRRSIIDGLFGDREAPGRIRELLGFLLRYSSSHFHVGAPVNVSAVLEREGGQPTAAVAKKIRWSILHHLAREEEIRRGPAQRPVERTYQLVMNDPSVQRHLALPTGAEATEAVPPGKRKEDPRTRAQQILRTMAADTRYGWIRFLDAIIDRVWDDIYDGIMVDAEGLSRVWQAARRGPVVMVPSHKSHIDYLVLSQVFFKDGMMPPHIAAGENLSFWPLGAIFRRSGAFFIRRSFAGDKLYSAICAAYVKRLLKDGHAVEFFIEGGRSRSGKLLPPKMGLLSMTVDPVLDGALNDVSFVPVSISYDKIIEARSYSRELGGGTKAKESVGGLLSTRKVLRSKYGRVYVDFDEPISLRAFAAARGFEIKPRPEIEAGDDPPAERKAFVAQLGHRVVFGINRVTRVTPTGVAAVVLLGATLRGMGEQELYARAERLLEMLAELGARLSSSLLEKTRRAAVREALGRLAQDGLVMILPAPDGENIFALDERGRRALDFYKNNIVHFLVPSGIVCAAVFASGVSSAKDAEVRALAQKLSRVLKHEFSFPVDLDFNHNFDAAVRGLVERRVLVSHEDTISVTLNGREQALELAGQIAVFFEGYSAAAEVALKLASGPRGEKEILNEALTVAQRQAMEGRIRRAEAASQLTMQNAIRVLLDFGVLVRAEGGKLALGSGGTEALAAFKEELVSVLKPLS